MAFDICVGGFARFFAREWENVAQKWARETGTHYHRLNEMQAQRTKAIVSEKGSLHLRR
jgi:hypothetical protein